MSTSVSVRYFQRNLKGYYMDDSECTGLNLLCPQVRYGSKMDGVGKRNYGTTLTNKKSPF